MTVSRRQWKVGVSTNENDDVFFLTLVDFLAQVLFFGLFVFVVYQASDTQKREKVESDKAEIAKAVEAAGVSNITELTDELTKLSPTQLKSFNDMIASAGGVKAVQALIAKAKREGGATAAVAHLEEFAKLKGADKPSCLVGVDGETRMLGTILATNEALEFTASTPELEVLLKRLGRRFEDVQRLPPGRFAAVFGPVLKLEPTCRYFVVFHERTGLVAPRRAVGQVFYLRLRG